MAANLKYKRLLLKLSGEALMGKQEYGIDMSVADRLARDIEGMTAAGAEVALWWPPRRPDDDGDGRMSGSILKTTKADADGAFAFDAPPARYRIWATLDNLATPRDTVHCVAVVVPAGDEAPKPVELRLKPAATVTATVKSRAAGRPIPGAVVEMGWGVFPEKFWPDEEGENFNLKDSSSPLEPYKNKTLFLKGVSNRIRGDGDGHMRGIGCLLTGIELFPGNIQGGSDTPAGWASGFGCGTRSGSGPSAPARNISHCLPSKRFACPPKSASRWAPVSAFPQ